VTPLVEQGRQCQPLTGAKVNGSGGIERDDRAEAFRVGESSVEKTTWPACTDAGTEQHHAVGSEQLDVGLGSSLERRRTRAQRTTEQSRLKALSAPDWTLSRQQ
jgi:hypothetical protein